MAKKAPDSIYCKLIKLTRQKEDFFTESLAFALQKDRSFLNSFMKLISGDKISNIDDSQLYVRTQVAVPFGRLDMVVTVNGSINVVIENKLWSKEGEGQLKKYLANNEINYLAFITAEDGYKIETSVLGNTKYLKPSQSNHFTWDAIFPVLEDTFAGNSAVQFYLFELRHLFLYLGFGARTITKTDIPTTTVTSVTPGVPVTPVAPTILVAPITNIAVPVPTEEIVVYDRKSSENIFTLQTNVQEKFQQVYKANLEIIDELLKKYRWGTIGSKTKEIGNKHGQIYAYNLDLDDSAKFLRLYITPTKEGNAVRIRITMNNKTDFTSFVDGLESNLEKYELLYELLPDLKKCEQVEVVIPLTDMPEKSTEVMEYLLYLYEIVLKSADKAKNISLLV